jgi:hypothetical protein
MLRIFSHLLSLSLLVFFIASLAYSGQKEKISVTVVGQGSLEGGTIGKAEKIALKNAFQLAIEQGLGTFVKSETEIANFDLVKDKIISKSEGYVLGYKKLRQWDDGKILNIKIKAVVSLKQLGNDFRAMLKAVTRQIDNPVMAFVLTAWEVPEATGPKKHLEGQILIDSFQEQFKNKGFDIKAADDAREFANTGTGKLAQVASGGRKAIAKYARDANANFVARGEITATFGGIDPATGAYKWTGTISGEIIDAATGELVASYSKTVIKKFPNKTQGLSALMHSGAENAARVLAKQTLETWQQYAGSGRVYNIFVSGYKNYKQKRAVKKALDKFCEIRGQTEDRKKKILSIDVIFKGSATELEDKSVEAMEENGLDVQDLIIDGNKMTIKL